MKEAILIYLFIISFPSQAQNVETVYALNEGVTINYVKKSIPINWGPTKRFPNASYIKIKKKNDGTFYVNIAVSGQFGYGHYFKYVGKISDEYKYIKTDGMKDDIILVNFPLGKLAANNHYDEKVILKMINYRTSFGMLMKF